MSSSPSLPPLLARRYVVVEEFPQKGLSGLCVCRARRRLSQLSRPKDLYQTVVIKWLDCEVPGARQRLENEIRLLESLNYIELDIPRHLESHLYPSSGTSHDASDSAYLVMSHCVGQPLAQLPLAELPVSRCTHLLKQLCATIAKLHGRNIVHLDLSPNNLLITRSGRLNVIDFDRACRLGSNGLTQDYEKFQGTSGYAHPEQGQADAVGRYCDSYAIARIAQLLITGQSPQTFALDNEDHYDDEGCFNWKQHSRLDLPLEIYQLLDRFLDTDPDYCDDNVSAAFHELNTLFPPRITRSQALWLTRMGHALVASALWMGLRNCGAFQAGELRTYDHLLRMRPWLNQEDVDERIVVVTIDDNDRQYQADRGWFENEPYRSLSDKALSRLLQRLEENNVAAIGLDIVRDFPAQVPELKQQLESADNLIGACSLDTKGLNGTEPPPELSVAQIGFVNIPDESDDIVRRQFLAADSSESIHCQSQYHFSALLAAQYLTQQGVDQSKAIHFIDSNYGEYYKAPDSNPNLVLLNYRANHSLEEAFNSISLTDIFQNKRLNLDLENKIVIIGSISRKYSNDVHNSPYGYGTSEQIPGVWLNAHMVSQLISFFADERPFIRVPSNFIAFSYACCAFLVANILLSLEPNPAIQRLLLLIYLNLFVYGLALALLAYFSIWLPLYSIFIGLNVGAFSCKQLIHRRLNQQYYL